MHPRPDHGFPVQYGKYQLLERIGHGGMAEVFRARLPGVAGFEKIVVIKRLLPHLAADRSMLEMFVNEAKIAAQVQHRNVVQVFELGQTDQGEFFMAMEHVEGTDLRQILRAAAINSMRIPPWFSVYLLAEILDGLAYAHELTDELGRRRGVVHRDVTPANMFVSYLGDIKLGDFGVAKDNSSTNHTLAGQLKGKVPYMSPEQLFGAELDARTDVFAAGVVLWECLTQRRLFGGRPDIEAMNLICYGGRRGPSELAGDVPRDVDGIVLRALAADVNMRTPSARHLRDELHEVMPKLRDRILQKDVRSIVESLLGSREPTPNTGPRLVHDDQMVRNFIEPTPMLGGPTPPGAWSQRSPVPATFGVVHAPTPTPRHPSFDGRPPSPLPRQPTGSRWAAPTLDRHNAKESFPLAPGAPVAPDVFGSPPAPMKERQVTDDFPRELLSNIDIPDMAAAPAYEGPHPFWVRGHAGAVLGPLELGDALGLLAAEGQGGHVESARISGNQRSWMDAATFAVLTGQEILTDRFAVRERELGRSSFAGSFQEGGVGMLFGRIARDRPTGRLVLVDAGVPVQRREIVVVEGRPTFVYANAHDLQLPELLVQKNLVAREQLPGFLHAALVQDRSLEKVVMERTGVDVARYFGAFMRERLLDLLRWKLVRFALDVDSPITHTTPFAASFMALLQELMMKLR